MCSNMQRPFDKSKKDKVESSSRKVSWLAFSFVPLINSYIIIYILYNLYFIYKYIYTHIHIHTHIYTVIILYINIYHYILFSYYIERKKIYEDIYKLVKSFSACSLTKYKTKKTTSYFYRTFRITLTLNPFSTVKSLNFVTAFTKN